MCAKIIWYDFASDVGDQELNIMVLTVSSFSVGDKRNVQCNEKEVWWGGREWLPWWEHVLPAVNVPASIGERRKNGL